MSLSPWATAKCGALVGIATAAILEFSIANFRGITFADEWFLLPALGFILGLTLGFVRSHRPQVSAANDERQP